MVVITGGSSGIGRCTGAFFARRGWHVGLIARGAPGLAASAAEIRAFGVPAATACADVTDSIALRAAADAIAGALGPPMVWINCAGNGVYGGFAQVPQAEFDQVTAVTYGGTVNGCRVALALMQPQASGTIVNVCSAVAFHGLPFMSSYAGAKAAVRAFAQALTAELSIQRSAIRVSTVFPPAVNTPFFSHAVSHMGWAARPARPVYQPEIIAEAVYMAAQSGRPEVLVTGTTALFALTTRLAPRLIAHAMRRLGFEGQLTRDPRVLQLQQSTLFVPSTAPSPVHGPFGASARRRSTHLWLARLWAAIRRPRRAPADGPRQPTQHRPASP